MINKSTSNAVAFIEDAIAGQDVLELADEAVASGEFREMLAAFAQLEDWRRQLEDALKVCKESSERLAPEIMEGMSLAGITSTRVEISPGNTLTVMTNTQRFVTKKSNKDGVTTQDVCDTLRELGLGDMVADGYSAARLKAKVLEWLDNGVEIPEQLSRQINVAETTKLTTRKS